MTATENDWLTWLHHLSEELAPAFAPLDEREERQTARILAAFKGVGLNQAHFAAETGYGYHDLGRGALESAIAGLWGADAALLRQQIVSGTQAINLCLQALAQPGREVLFLGEPYDTLKIAVGLRGSAPGNLVERGVRVRVAEMPDPLSVWPEALSREIGPHTTMVCLQRSGGYTTRPALPAGMIGDLAAVSAGLPGRPLIFVDNCYGEFVEEEEPTEKGADLMAGSLIKNPGGGLAPCGGYVVGRRELVGRVAAQLYAPGLGTEIGPSLLSPRHLFQGIFQAPHLVGQALRGAILCARAMQLLGFATSPAWDTPRADLVQRITFGHADLLLRFCRAVQGASPVDARAIPEPSILPGYADPVIMAGGTFVQGSTSELSVDAPMRPPYAAYWQGGLSFCHARLALAHGLASLGLVPPS